MAKLTDIIYQLKQRAVFSASQRQLKSICWAVLALSS